MSHRYLQLARLYPAFLSGAGVFAAFISFADVEAAGLPPA